MWVRDGNHHAGHPRQGSLRVGTSAEMIRIARERESGGAVLHTRIDDERFEGFGLTAEVAFNVSHLIDAAAVIARITVLLPPDGNFVSRTHFLAAMPWYVRLGVRVARVVENVYTIDGLDFEGPAERV